jgi:hypothetical protein
VSHLPALTDHQRNGAPAEYVNVPASVLAPNGGPGTLVLHLKAVETTATGQTVTLPSTFVGTGEPVRALSSQR